MTDGEVQQGPIGLVDAVDDDAVLHNVATIALENFEREFTLMLNESATGREMVNDMQRRLYESDRKS